MEVKWDARVLAVLEQLEQAGHRAVLVGGCVRDRLLGRPLHDYDGATSALPDQIISACNRFRCLETGKKHGTITVLSGSFDLDCADDAVHAGGDVSISDGAWTIRSADDGIHADGDVLIGGGSFELPYCYEGIEGKNVTIDGGSISITSDDGINATGEETGNSFGPGMDTGAVITVNGGELTIVSDGDCIDSNGTIVLNDGKLNLTCNGNGNTALDSESGITNNGADVTTNDGSENGGGFGMGRGQMGGDRGQFGGQFPQDGQFPGKGQGRPEGDFRGGGSQPDDTSQAPLPLLTPPAPRM